MQKYSRLQEEPPGIDTAFEPEPEPEPEPVPVPVPKKGNKKKKSPVKNAALLAAREEIKSLIQDKTLDELKEMNYYDILMIDKSNFDSMGEEEKKNI